MNKTRKIIREELLKENDIYDKDFGDLMDGVIAFKTMLKRNGDIQNSKDMSVLCAKFMKDMRKIGLE
jgi:hypothetical protein